MSTTADKGISTAPVRVKSVVILSEISTPNTQSRTGMEAYRACAPAVYTGHNHLYKNKARKGKFRPKRGGVNCESRD